MKIVYSYNNGITLTVTNPKIAYQSRNGITYFIPGAWDNVSITCFYFDSQHNKLVSMEKTFDKKQAPVEGLLDKWGCPYARWDGVSIDPIYGCNSYNKLILGFGAISYPFIPRGNCGVRRYITGVPSYT